MSWVSEVKDICGDYYIEIKYYEGQKEAITLFFNSRRNAETVKRCIELDDSVPNVATAVDFVEVVRCENCAKKVDYKGRVMCSKNARVICGELCGLTATDNDHFCSYGERKNYEKNEEDNC